MSETNTPIVATDPPVVDDVSIPTTMKEMVHDDLKAIVREGDDLGLVTRGEFNRLVAFLSDFVAAKVPAKSRNTSNN